MEKRGEEGRKTEQREAPRKEDKEELDSDGFRWDQGSDSEAFLSFCGPHSETRRDDDVTASRTAGAMALGEGPAEAMAIVPRSKKPGAMVGSWCQSEPDGEEGTDASRRADRPKWAHSG